MTDLEILVKWQEWIEKFVIEDIRKSLKAPEDSAIQIGLIILSLLGTECLSGYYVGKPADDKTFSEFMRKYFPPAYSKYDIQIYKSLRNGLLHDYVTKKIPIGGVEINPFNLNGKAGEPHLMPVYPGRDYPVWFNRVSFATDFIEAWNKYVSDIYTDPNLLKRMVDRAKLRGFMSVGPVPPLPS